MRFAAFFRLHKICTLLHRSKFNILPRDRFKKSAIKFFVKFSATVTLNICKFRKNQQLLYCLPNFKFSGQQIKISVQIFKNIRQHESSKKKRRSVQRPPQGASAAPRRGCSTPAWLPGCLAAWLQNGPQHPKKTYTPSRYPLA